MIYNEAVVNDRVPNPTLCEEVTGEASAQYSDMYWVLICFGVLSVSRLNLNLTIVGPYMNIICHHYFHQILKPAI